MFLYCIFKITLRNLKIVISSCVRMPTFFLRNCCLITRDGEGTQPYLDYLIAAPGIDVSTLPVVDMQDQYSYKHYDWLDMFAWFEFQRRCLILVLEVLVYFSKIQIGRESYYHMLTALTRLFTNNAGGLWFEGEKFSSSLRGRPTTREWRDRIPNFSQRIFIPAFSLILEEIQAILPKAKLDYIRRLWSTSPIRLCLPCPIMGYSQASLGSYMFRKDDLSIRQGAMCYFARLEGSCWCDAAFGKMSFIEPFEESFNSFISQRLAFYEGDLNSQLVRGNSQRPDAANESCTSQEEIPDFAGPFHHNVRYDREAFLKIIVSRWHYKRCLIRFLLYRALIAIYLHNIYGVDHQRFHSTSRSTAIVKARR